MVRRRSQARRRLPDARPRRSAPQRATLLGWGAAAALMVAIAFIVGRPATEQGVLGASPDPTPTPPLAIAFGTGLDGATNRAVGATERFRSGDPFAYSVTMPGPAGVDAILVQVTRLEGARRVVVQEPSVQHILPEPRTFAFQVPTDDLLAAWGAGDYEMLIFLEEAAAEPLARGRFTLIATPGE
ncbi:MAG: hypothetical protein ACRDHD_06645 [Candidatus Limnocylindria bacterium]